MLRYQALAELLCECNRAPSKWVSIDPVPLSFPFPIRHPRGTGIPTLREGCFFVGAEKEEGYAELATRRIGAAVRGEVLREIANLSARDG
jgi:hypothetical protein